MKKNLKPLAPKPLKAWAIVNKNERIILPWLVGSTRKDSWKLFDEWLGYDDALDLFPDYRCIRILISPAS